MYQVEWVSEAGSRVSKKLLSEAAELVRAETKDCVVIAMAMRENGVTQREVVSLLGKPHRNIIKRLIQDNKVKQYVLPDGSRSRRVKLVRR